MKTLISHDFACPSCKWRSVAGFAGIQIGMIGRKVTLIDDNGRWEKWIEKYKCPKCGQIFTCANGHLDKSTKQTNPKNNDLDYIKDTIIKQGVPRQWSAWGDREWDGYFFQFKVLKDQFLNRKEDTE